MWVVDEGGRREIPKDYQLQEAQEKLAPIQADLEQQGLQVSTEVCLGNPLKEILDAALEYDISAIAVSSDNLGKLIAARSFAGELFRRSWHPILFFPPSK